MAKVQTPVVVIDELEKATRKFWNIQSSTIVVFFVLLFGGFIVISITHQPEAKVLIVTLSAITISISACMSLWYTWRKNIIVFILRDEITAKGKQRRARYAHDTREKLLHTILPALIILYAIAITSAVLVGY